MKNFTYKELDIEGFQTLEVIAAADNFNHWMYETISPFCGERILEIGSGIGNISKFFLNEGKNIVLSDIRSNYCDYLAQRFDLNEKKLIRNLDLTDPDIKSKFHYLQSSFDTVFALNVVEHIKEDHLAISNCMSFLKPAGNLIILVPAYKFLYNSFDVELGHYRRYTKDQLSSLFLASGLSLQTAKYFNAAGMVGWLISGKLQRHKTIPMGQMTLYNKLVPLFKIFDRLLFNQTGLSVIVVGKKQLP